MNVTHGTVAGDGVQLHYVEAGAGPAIILLHGFPDFWYSWRHQIQPLADAGYRVIAPDLRGYNRSERPEGVAAYRMPHLVADAAALIRQLSPDGAVVAGHDWGGIIAWQLAAQRPDLVRRLIILNAPHPDAYLKLLRRSPSQAFRSWYVLANQLPWLPEAALRFRRHAMLRRILSRAEDGSRMAGKEEVEEYVRAFSRPGALTAALNYYRAAARSVLSFRREPAGRVDVPTLIIWGERDPFLDASLPDAAKRYSADIRIERLPQAGHFVHWQERAATSALMIAWLKAGPALPPRPPSQAGAPLPPKRGISEES